MVRALRDFTVPAVLRLVFLIHLQLNPEACAYPGNTVQLVPHLPHFALLVSIAKTMVFLSRQINAVVDTIVQI